MSELRSLAKARLRAAFDRIRLLGNSPNAAAARALREVAGLETRPLMPKVEMQLPPPASWMVGGLNPEDDVEDKSSGPEHLAEPEEMPDEDNWAGVVISEPFQEKADTAVVSAMGKGEEEPPAPERPGAQELGPRAGTERKGAPKRKEPKKDLKAREQKLKVLQQPVLQSGTKRSRMAPLESWRNERVGDQESPRPAQTEQRHKDHRKGQKPMPKTDAKPKQPKDIEAESHESPDCSPDLRKGRPGQGSEKEAKPRGGKSLLGTLDSARLRTLARPLVAFAEAPSLNGFKGKPSLARLAAEAAAAVGNAPAPKATTKSKGNRSASRRPS